VGDKARRLTVAVASGGSHTHARDNGFQPVGKCSLVRRAERRSSPGIRVEESQDIAAELVVDARHLGHEHVVLVGVIDKIR
jgi:hypothetical protein